MAWLPINWLICVRAHLLMFPFVGSINCMHGWNSFCLNVSMICPIGLRWRLEMKQTQTSLRGELKIEGIQLLHVHFSSDVLYQQKSPICILIFFRLLICCGLWLFILRQAELCWENGQRQQHFTVILDCCTGPSLLRLPSQGLPSFPNSCRYSPCQVLTTTDQSLANSVFGSGQPC